MASMEKYRLFSPFHLIWFGAWIFAALLNCRGGDGDSPPPTLMKPETPQNFTATADSRQVTLDWSREAGVSYHLYHSETQGFDPENGTKIVTPPYIHKNLTNGTTYYYRLTAVNSAGESEPTAEQSATPRAQIAQISAGGSHTCAVAEGGAWCWGEGGDGRLGHNEPGNENANKSQPAQVYGLTSGVTEIAAGFAHTCALVNGGVWCWGSGGFGQLGHNEAGNERGDKSQPTQVMGLTSGVTEIAAGFAHTCALVNGGAWCWGSGGFGQLGHNEAGNERGHKSQPTRVMGLTSGVTQISAGANHHTCAVVDGAALCWGQDPLVIFLDSQRNPRNNFPQQVHGLTSGVTQISTGATHACAVVEGGAWCWGAGGFGQLGHNEPGNENKSQPIQVMGLTSGVTQISAGADHTCAVVGGAAKCWGAGGSGQLGHNEGDGTANKPAPTQVVGLTSGVTQITAGAAHTCALVNGQVLCWGAGTSGQLGNDAKENSPVPVPLSGL